MSEIHQALLSSIKSDKNHLHLAISFLLPILAIKLHNLYFEPCIIILLPLKVPGGRGRGPRRALPATVYISTQQPGAPAQHEPPPPHQDLGQPIRRHQLVRSLIQLT